MTALKRGIFEGKDMITGTVKWFNADKGYGFIAVDGEDDVFVHITAVQESGLTLTEDMKISFEKQQGKNGKYSAVNLVTAI
jgi:CspA family cold shock protein